MNKTLLLLLPLLLFGQALVANSKTTGDREIDFEEIVVTATRTHLPLKYTPVITRVISGADITRQGISSLEELLQKELAGVEFHQAGYGKTVSFQGLDARYVLFLVDGERMAGETYGNIDYDRIPMSNIEQIEIIRGASSVLYGSNAMGAIVNIITRMPRDRVEVNGSFKMGTNYQRNKDEVLGQTTSQKDLNKYRKKIDLPNTKTDLSVGFNLGKFRSLTTGSFRTTDAYKMKGRRAEKRHYNGMNLMQLAGFAPNGMPIFDVGRTAFDTTIMVEPDSRGLGVSGTKDWYVGQKLDYTISKKFRIELSGNYTKKYRYDFRNSIMDDNPMSGIMPNEKAWEYESYEGYDVKFLMEHSPNEKNKVYVTYIRDEHYRYQEQLGADLTPKQRHTYNIPRILWTSDFGRWNRLTTGVEMVNEQLRLDAILNPKGYDDVKSMNTVAVYVQDELFGGRKLSFVGGVRADWNDKFGWRVTPQLSAKYMFSDFTLRGSYSKGYRLPSLKEMYMKFSIPMPGSPVISGNDNLKAESNHYLSLSLEYRRDRLNLSATVNKSYFRNKIDVVWIDIDGGTSGQREMQYQNINRSEYGSIELIGRYRILENLHLSANYNYVYQSDNAPEESTQYIFPSAHTATFGINYYKNWKNLRMAVNANVRYVGAKKYEDFMSYLSIPKPALEFIQAAIAGTAGRPTQEQAMALRQIKYFMGSYTSEHDGYAVCNASIDLEFYRKISLTLGVNNIFDYTPKVVNFNSALTPHVNGFAKIGFKF